MLWGQTWWCPGRSTAESFQWEVRGVEGWRTGGPGDLGQRGQGAGAGTRMLYVPFRSSESYEGWARQVTFRFPSSYLQPEPNCSNDKNKPMAPLRRRVTIGQGGQIATLKAKSGPFLQALELWESGGHRAVVAAGQWRGWWWWLQGQWPDMQGHCQERLGVTWKDAEQWALFRYNLLFQLKKKRSISISLVKKKLQVSPKDDDTKFVWLINTKGKIKTHMNRKVGKND